MLCMIAKDATLSRICKSYYLVKNYIEARFDKNHKWQLHHIKEIDENKSAKELMEENRYFDVQPEELIFLTINDHARLHGVNLFGDSTEKHHQRLLKASETLKAFFKENPDKITVLYGKDNIFSNKEFIEKNAAKKRKKVYCFENKKEYVSIGDAAKDLNLTAKCVSLVCHGKLKSAGGKKGYKIKYTFKFI